MELDRVRLPAGAPDRKILMACECKICNPTPMREQVIELGAIMFWSVMIYTATWLWLYSQGYA